VDLAMLRSVDSLSTVKCCSYAYSGDGSFHLRDLLEGVSLWYEISGLRRSNNYQPCRLASAVTNSIVVDTPSGAPEITIMFAQSEEREAVLDFVRYSANIKSSGI